MIGQNRERWVGIIEHIGFRTERFIRQLCSREGRLCEPSFGRRIEMFISLKVALLVGLFLTQFTIPCISKVTAVPTDILVPGNEAGVIERLENFENRGLSGQFAIFILELTYVQLWAAVVDLLEEFVAMTISLPAVFAFVVKILLLRVFHLCLLYNVVLKFVGSVLLQHLFHITMMSYGRTRAQLGKKHRPEREPLIEELTIFGILLLNLFVRLRKVCLSRTTCTLGRKLSDTTY
ncbi:hypothetical protein Gasu2_48230 [Galdieria sulphuraria]|nr:hypothetical protein Gasu2_48230 [Galdieria sulphuraria]